jgi:DHA1 family multidrug resistance protein-like MFS transporter
LKVGPASFDPTFLRVVGLGVATALMTLSHGIVSPVLPLYAQSFGVSLSLVGLLVAGFGIARLLANLPAGILAGRLGRRRVLFLGAVVSTLGGVLSGLAGSFEHLVVARMLNGVGSALFITSALTYVADVSTPATRGRYMSVYQSCFLLGITLGPVPGGFLADLIGLRAPFFAIGLASAAAALWVTLYVPESRPPAPGGGSAGGGRGGGIGRLLRNRNFVLISLIAFGVFFTRGGVQQTLLPVIGRDRFGLSPSQLGILFGSIAAINLLTIPVGGLISDRLGRKASVVPGSLLDTLGLFLLSIEGSPAQFWAGSLLLGLGSGLSGPASAAYVSDIAAAGLLSLALALYRTLADVGLVAGPPLLGGLSDLVGVEVALLAATAFRGLGTAAFGLLAVESLRRPAGKRPAGEAGQ